MSIQSQKGMLSTYAYEHGYEIAGVYSDDGSTGTTYNRPEFMLWAVIFCLLPVHLPTYLPVSQTGRFIFVHNN